MRLKALIPILLMLCPHLCTAIEWNERKYHEIELSIQLPQFGKNAYDVTTFGAKPTITPEANQKAIQNAIDQCSTKGGGRVIIPSGVTLTTGAIHLKSHVNLVVEKGATLRFAFNPQLYPIVETSWEGIDCYNLSPCIYAFQQTDIAITGNGTIDGNGSRQTWWPWCGASKFGWKEGMAGAAATLAGRRQHDQGCDHRAH